MNTLTVVALLAGLALSAAQGLRPTGSTGEPLGSTPNSAANNAANTGSGINQMLTNPALSYGLMGGDNLMRAMMAPYMARFGNVPAYYFLRGGMDNFSSVLMSDMMNRALARSTGINPLMSAFMTGQMFDAPDNYALSNMLLNGNGRGRAGQTNQNQNQNQMGGGGMGGGGGMNPFLLAPFLF